MVRKYATVQTNGARSFNKTVHNRSNNTARSRSNEMCMRDNYALLRKAHIFVQNYITRIYGTQNLFLVTRIRVLSRDLFFKCNIENTHK